MRLENRGFLEIEDILGIELECLYEDCGATVSLPVANFKGIPEKCSHCGKDWFGGSRDSRRAELATLFSALGDMRKMMKKSVTDGVKLKARFEITPSIFASRDPGAS